MGEYAEAVTERYSKKKLFWKYAANLQEKLQQIYSKFIAYSQNIF